jgi:hypothetical protein
VTSFDPTALNTYQCGSTNTSSDATVKPVNGYVTIKYLQYFDGKNGSEITSVTVYSDVT